MTWEADDAQNLIRIISSLERITEFLEKSEEQLAKRASVSIPAGPANMGAFRGIRDTAAAMFAMAGVTDADDRIQTRFFTSTLKNFKYLKYVGTEDGAVIYAKTEKTDLLPGIFIKNPANTDRLLAYDICFDSREFDRLFIVIWGGQNQFITGYTKYLEYTGKMRGQ